MRLARTALQGPWPGREIKDAALALVRLSAQGDLGGALEEAYRYQTLVQTERVQAENAASPAPALGAAASRLMPPVIYCALERRPSSWA